MLTQVRTLVGSLDERKADIVSAIESVNRLAVTARQHQDSIDRALDEPAERPRLAGPPARRPGADARRADQAQQRGRPGHPDHPGLDGQHPQVAGPDPDPDSRRPGTTSPRGSAPS
ncbi:hypothetical protein G5V59_13645 [Nocardioides sp. W3-2-3]|uniref:hypothetical protein n=1 Tax=Nocardioides convexus TaxID=2712224 RepID=UPI0024182585|nr:hypothetical protein [Nocardioides convexus]NHA00700.1 hypothetical protein [Nocardioides convexus]